jgi:hypothetical protein
MEEEGHVDTPELRVREGGRLEVQQISPSAIS